MTFGAFASLGRAATITTRFCAVRTQFSPSPGMPESPVLDYQAVQARNLPLLPPPYSDSFPQLPPP